MSSKQTGVELTEDNLVKQLIRYGYFHEYFPPCFSTESLCANADEVLGYISSISKIYELVSQPLDYSTHKDTTCRRVISIPNPLPFLRTVAFLRSHWKECRIQAESPNSQSPITFMIDYGTKPLLNINSQRDHLGLASSFVQNLFDRIKTSIGRPYKLSLDLHDCYGSIYTHALAWALCGKEYAKAKYIKASIPDDPEKEKAFDFANEFDEVIRSQKANETNGILTGPFTSRIFSEILLSGIDRALAGNKRLTPKNYIFKRYVDDYAFYFHSEHAAKQGAEEIVRVLESFGLKANPNKTIITPYPFDIYIDLEKEIFGAPRRSRAISLYEILNQASKLVAAGEKGAYRFALKKLREEQKPPKVDAQSLAQLVNIGISYPNCSTLVFNCLESSQNTFDQEDLKDALNTILADALDSNLDQEATNAFYYLFQLGLEIQDESVDAAIVKGNDLCRLMALDLLKNSTDQIEYSHLEPKSLAERKKELETRLKTCPINSSHWLLIYESLNRDLLKINPLKDNSRWNCFFKKLASLNISFYKSASEPNFDWAI